MMLHTKYQFHVFPILSLCKTCDPGAGHFLHICLNSVDGDQLASGKKPADQEPHCSPLNL